MSSENISNIEESNYNNISESQTLDSLLQNTCDTPSHCESNETLNNIESKPEIAPESFRKRSHSESMNAYINTLKPKDVIIFLEDIKYFSNGTAFMCDFRTSFIDPILKYLNGGDPLKNDFGRDPHTSAYSLFTFSSLNTSINDACRDTVRIIQIMDTFDNFKSSERNLNMTKISMKVILEKAKNEFLYFDNYRNNHPKRKRFLIYIFHSDICLDDIDDLVKDLNSMKVRFAAFGVYKHEACVQICDAFNYNNKGSKDLSCFGRSDRWPITISNGLYKYFESSKTKQSKNKNLKWANSREQNESNEFELGFMTSVTSQMPDNVMQHMMNAVSDSQLNTSLNVRSIPSNDIIDSNYSQSSNFIAQNPNIIPHANMQSKYVPTSSSSYYPNVSNQSEMQKNNQIPFFSPQEQYYPTSSSVNNSSHRSTPSLLPSQATQFHALNSHASMPQTPIHSDQMKPNSVENLNDIISPMSNLSNQLSLTKSNQISQEMDINSSLHRFPNGNMSFNSNNNMNPANFNQNRFIPRQPFYSMNHSRTNTVILFEGIMKYHEENLTDLRILMEQHGDISCFMMNSWEKQCSLHYINYLEAYHPVIYGKSGTDIEGGNADGTLKVAFEVQFKINQQAIDSITAMLSPKPNQTLLGIIRPFRQIQQDIHVQCICVILNRNGPGIKFLIPADQRTILNELRKYIQSSTYSSNAMYNQMKRNNFVTNNQQMYGIPQSLQMQRPMINRYSSHSGSNIPMMPVSSNPNYRNMSHPSGFVNNQQISPAPNYILHAGQYGTNPNQQPTGYNQMQMEMNMQSNSGGYEQNY